MIRLALPTSVVTVGSQKYLIVAALLTALWLESPLTAAETLGSSRLPQNQAVLARPRTLEEFPELLRPTSSVQRLQARELSRRQLLREVAANRAVAARPRTLEEYPELARTAPTLADLQARARERQELLLKVAANRAVAARPRTLEEYPELAQMAASGQGWLTSRPGKPFNLAPLK